MMTMNKDFYCALSLFVLLISMTRNGSADNGVNVDVDEQVSIPNVGTLRVKFTLDTCHTSMFFNVSFNNRVILATDVPDLRNSQVCWKPADYCDSCFTLRNLIINPAFVSATPTISTNCRIAGIPVGGDTALGNIRFGEDCSQHTSCDTCASSKCGWCGTADTGRCLSSGSSGPYCDSCPSSSSAPSSVWVSSSTATCPLPPQPVRVGLIVGLTVGLVGGALAFGAVCFVYRRKKRRSQNRTERLSEPNFSLENDVQHESLNNDEAGTPRRASSSSGNNGDGTSKSNVQVHVDSTASPFEFLQDGK